MLSGAMLIACHLINTLMQWKPLQNVSVIIYIKNTHMEKTLSNNFKTSKRYEYGHFGS